MIMLPLITTPIQLTATAHQRPPPPWHDAKRRFILHSTPPLCKHEQDGVEDGEDKYCRMAGEAVKLSVDLLYPCVFSVSVWTALLTLQCLLQHPVSTCRNTPSQPRCKTLHILIQLNCVATPCLNPPRCNTPSQPTGLQHLVSTCRVAIPLSIHCVATPGLNSPCCNTLSIHRVATLGLNLLCCNTQHHVCVAIPNPLRCNSLSHPSCCNTALICFVATSALFSLKTSLRFSSPILCSSLHLSPPFPLLISLSWPFPLLSLLGRFLGSY